MPLELHPNDSSREAVPSIWIFSGQSAFLLVVGVGVAVGLFRILESNSVDWWLALPISLIPLGAITLFVHVLVNGKAPSYAGDLLKLEVWRFKCRLWYAGALERPPLLWDKNPRPPHPAEYV